MVCIIQGDKMNKTEMDTMEKTVKFYDSEGRLLLSATLGIQITDLVTERQIDYVNKLLWDFPDLVEKKVVSVSE